MKPTPEDMARDLSADLAACDAAHPGPWTPGNLMGDDEPSHYCIPVSGPDCATPAHCYGSRRRKANAVMIAASREGWPAAIRRALAAEAEVARLKARLAEADPRRGPCGFRHHARDCDCGGAGGDR